MTEKSKRSGSEKRARDVALLSGPPGYWEWVREEASRRRISVSELVREALAAYLAPKV